MPLRIPIRIRIALSIFALSSGLLVVMSFLVYVGFERQLRENLDDTLRLQAAANLEFVKADQTPPVLTVGIDPGHQRSAGEAVLRLYDADGAVLADGSPASAAAPSEKDVVIASLQADHDVYRTVVLSDNEEYRIVASPVRHAGRVTGVLVTGIEWSRVNQPLEVLRLILLIAVGLTAAALAGGAYVIARRALQPVAAIAATARRITRGDLQQRIAATSSRDELGELTSTLNSMIGRLAETVERERRFTADASHELRTPLAAIEAGIDVTLAHDRTIAEYQRVLRIVLKQTQSLHRLAQQLLLLSRLDAQELQAEFVSIELEELVDAVVESFRDTHALTRVRVVDPSGGLTVRGDVELLARALTNILENAVVHVGPDVALTIETRATRDGSAMITIEDDGPGVGEALAPEVFQRFRRGDVSRSGGGTGLGLAIVDSILHVHAGSVLLLPARSGSGACFALALPLAPSGRWEFPGRCTMRPERFAVPAIPIASPVLRRQHVLLHRQLLARRINLARGEIDDQDQDRTEKQRAGADRAESRPPSSTVCER